MYKKTLSWILAFIMVFSILGVFSSEDVEALDSYIVNDDFESDTVGDLPDGWIIKYDGDGVYQQAVVDTVSNSGSNSFKLDGASSWSATIYKNLPAELPDNLILEAYIMPASVGESGSISLFNKSGDTWGAYLARLVFGNEEIYYSTSGHDQNNLVTLQSYDVNTWYHVKLVHDLVARKFDIYIDGAKRAENVDFYSSYDVDSLVLSSGNASGTNLIYYDDIKLYYKLGIIEVTTLPDITLPYGSNSELPKTVGVTYENESNAKVEVTWDKEIDTNIPGTYKLTGSIEETELTASLTVIVEEPKITEVTTLSAITVTSGSDLELPETVEVTYDDGSKEYEKVTWDKEIDTNVTGTYKLTGSIEGTELTASLTVIVEEPEEPTTTTRPSVPKLEIKTEMLPGGVQGEEYQLEVEGEGGKEPYTWSAEGLPEGLSISEEGKISGVPEESGIFSVKIEVLDSRSYYRSGVFDLEIVTDESEGVDSKEEDTKENPFSDTNEHWAIDYIKGIMEKNIINGYPDGTFRPNNNVTREEFASLLVRVLELERNSEMTFEDALNRWSTEDVATAAYHNIVDGYDETNFGPADFITREQMAVMIARALGLEAAEVETEFKDMEDMSQWAKPSVLSVLNKGLIEGYPDGSFKPKDYLTRAEAVKVIYLVMEELDKR